MWYSMSSITTFIKCQIVDLNYWNLQLLIPSVSTVYVKLKVPEQFFQLGRHPSIGTCTQWPRLGTAGRTIPTGCYQILWFRSSYPAPGGQNIPGSTALTRRNSCVWDQLMRYFGWCRMLSYLSRQHSSFLCSIRCHIQSRVVDPVHIMSCIYRNYIQFFTYYLIKL